MTVSVEVLNEYLALSKELDRHAYLFHVVAAPEITDAEYDTIRRRALTLEEKNPGLKEAIDMLPVSERIGSQVIGGKFPKVKHGSPMRSLQDKFDAEEVLDWLQSLPPGTAIVEEDKGDGLALRLTYIDGRLFNAATRGDGSVGEDVTPNAMEIDDIPLVLMSKTSRDYVCRRPCIVTGEVMVLHSDYAEVNARMAAEGKKGYVNPRSYASGSLRQSDSRVTAERRLMFRAYSVEFLDGEGFELYHEEREWMENFRFQPLRGKLLPETSDQFNIALVQAYLDDALEERKLIDHDIDGRVWKVDCHRIRAELGYRTTSPRYAIAYKFPADNAITKLLGITYQLGRTGIHTPVAELEPVFCGGVTVKRSTLHNIDEILRLDLRRGDYVQLERAGDVIPKVIGVVHNLRQPMAVPYGIPHSCVGCGHDLDLVRNKDSGAASLICRNPNCVEQVAKTLFYQTSRNVLNIMDIGQSFCTNWARHCMKYEAKQPLLFLMDASLASIQEVEPSKVMSLKIFNNVVAARRQHLWRVIAALCIEDVGETTAKALANHYRTLKGFFGAGDEVMNIPDIGEVVGANILNWLDYNDNMEALVERAFPDIIEPAEVVASAWTGKSVVVTGSMFGDQKRKAVEEWFKERGAKVTSSVTGGTSLVVLGTKYTEHKAKTAYDMNIQVIDTTQGEDYVS